MMLADISIGPLAMIGAGVLVAGNVSNPRRYSSKIRHNQNSSGWVCWQ
jgi:hypothetical protein